jgi:uncharacterized protein YukE
MFKYGEAKAWKQAVEELNEEADALLKEVAAAINEIGDGCEGVMVESLVDVARGLTNRFTELVTSLGKLVEALGEVIMNFLNMEEELKSGITEVASTLLGGLLG